MKHEIETDEARLGRWLSAARADADPAVWTRARARLEARGRELGAFEWLLRPVALAISGALFAASLAVGVMLVRATPVDATSDASLAANLLEVDTSIGLESQLGTTSSSEASSDVPPDSGARR